MTAFAAALPTLLGVLALVGVTVLVLWASRIRFPLAPAWAVLRGLVQLAAISVILTGVITRPGWVGMALIVMFLVAAVTAARRLGRGLSFVPVVAAAMGVGAVVALGIPFASGALEFTPRYALALGGILIGNTMSIATLAGSRFLEVTSDRWAEVEGWLALGATPQQSTRLIARDAVHSSLIPSIDQTKTTGLVTLPGAFVGAIFGGVSPLEAGRFQLVVLAAILAAGAITAVLLVRFLAPVHQRPLPR